MKILQKILRSF